MILTAEEFKSKFVANPDQLFNGIDVVDPEHPENTTHLIDDLLEIAENNVKIDLELNSLPITLTYKTLVAYEALRNWYSTRVIKEEMQTYYTNKYKEIKDKIISIPIKCIDPNISKINLERINEEVLNEQLSKN